MTLKISSVFGICSIILSSLFLLSQNRNEALSIEDLPPSRGAVVGQTKYLAFQIFTGTHSSPEILRNLGPGTDKEKTVENIIRAIGTVGSQNRKLGFFVGPLSFDHTDDEIVQIIRESFALALEKNIAVGFHIDDSMFWRRLSFLNSIENIEWLDWDKTPNTGRLLNWSITSTKLMPQLCYGSPAVLVEVKKRAELIGGESKRGVDILKKVGKGHLFIGIIAGWETRLSKDFETEKPLGFNALARKGYTKNNTKAEIDEGRVEIVKDFIDFWTSSLANTGIPYEKIYSHAALPQINKKNNTAGGSLTYLEAIDFSPPRVAIGRHRTAGLSTYPPFEIPDEIRSEYSKNGFYFASSEGTAMDPAAAAMGGSPISIESYLAYLFNNGAILVNYFGWEVGPNPNSPFRKAAEGEEALAAYRKFLKGLNLHEEAKAPQISSLQIKIQKLQLAMPRFVRENGPEKIKALAESLQLAIKSGKMKEAEEIAGVILKITGE